MKLVKMSMVAALLLSGGSAFALENTKIGGDVNFNYATSDASGASLLAQEGAAGQAALNLNITTDLGANVKAGVSTSTLTTLGLENSIVAGPWAGTTATQNWITEAWIEAKVGATTAKVGRQSIDTPLMFTEDYNMARNTFDAVMAVNDGFANTQVVAGFIGNGNGVAGSVVGADASEFTAVGGAGAYVLGATNNSIKNVDLQAWYYNVIDNSTAVWVQADATLGTLLDIGVQYAGINSDASADASAKAVRVGYKYAGLNASIAYSTTDADGGVNIANIATGNAGRSVSKLYTEAEWNFGYVGAANTKALKLGVEGDYAGAALGAFYTNTDNGGTRDMTELAISATKSYGALDTKVVLLNTAAEDINAGDKTNAVQVYLTYNF